MLIKKSERRRGRAEAAAARTATNRAAVWIAAAFLRRSGLVAGSARDARRLPLTSIRKADAGPPPPAGATVTTPQEHLHPLLGRLLGDRRGRQRRVDRPGAGLRQPDQSRLALLQGRGGPRRRAERAPAALSGEARGRPMEADLLGSGDRRDRRQAAGDSPEGGTGLGLLARLGQVHQRSRLSQPQVRRLLGNQQFRSSGAHLPLHHRHRRRQYLGLRRDDQQLQRHPQRQDHRGHGRQSRRGASGFAAAYPRRQGAQPRQHDRHRSADDADRGARDRICARASRHAHRRRSTGCSGTFSRTAGRTRNSSASASTAWTISASEVAKWTPARGRARHRPARSAGQARRRDVRQAEAGDADLGDGADPVHDRNGECPRELHSAARHRQCRACRRRRQHFPRPYQRAGRDRPRPRCDDAAALLRPHRRRLAALVPGVGGGLRLDAVALRQQDADGNAGHPEHALVRRHLAAEGPGQPARHRAGHVHHGTWRQHDHADAGGGARDREARAAGRVRSLSDHLVGALGAQGRHLSAAGLHQLRDGRLAHGVEPLAAVGRADRGAGLRIEERLRHDVHARAQVRLRRPDVQEHQGRERRGVGRGHSARDQSRRLVDRLLRPVARAAQGAHEEPGQVRSGHAAGAEGRSGGRRRLLRPAVAVLGNAGVQASRARRSSTTPICR